MSLQHNQCVDKVLTARYGRCMKKSILAAAAIAAAALLHPAVALADPDEDDPGYSIDGGSSSPGQEHYPHVCSVAPYACGLHYNPGPGTWTRIGDGGDE